MSSPAVPLRAVVFDLDGLMFNTEEIYQDVCRELCRRREKEYCTGLLDQMMGRPARGAFQAMIDWHQLTETIDELAEESGVIFSGILDGRLAPMPGLFELLQSLETHGFDKAVATSSARKYATHVLGRYELEPRFRFLLCAEDVTDGKPHPEVYQKAANQLGLRTDEILVLEDSQNGCRAAVAAGAYAVAVPGGHSLTHKFDGARFVADGLHDRRILAALGIPAPSSR